MQDGEMLTQILMDSKDVKIVNKVSRLLSSCAYPLSPAAINMAIHAVHMHTHTHQAAI